MITLEDEDRTVACAESCGTDIYNALTHRHTGRAADLADLAYAYHVALTCIMRANDVTDEERLFVHRVLERVEANASAAAEKAMREVGRLKVCDG